MAAPARDGTMSIVLCVFLASKEIISRDVHMFNTVKILIYFKKQLETSKKKTNHKQPQPMIANFDKIHYH